MVEFVKNNLPANVQLICLQYRINDDERAVLDELGVYIPAVDFFNEVLLHGKYVGICDFVITPGTLIKQLAGLFDVPTLSWGENSWSSLGRREYPWYRSIATLQIERDHSLSSLAYQLSRWLNLAIEHTFPKFNSSHESLLK